MKKIIILFIGVLAVLFATRVDGQTTFGIKGGVSVADISDNGYKPRVSGHGGIYVNRMFNKYFAIQPEVLFSGEGQQYVYNSVEHTWALNYIQIPLMLQVYPIKEIYLEAGPQLGLLVSARDKLGGDTHPNIKANFATAQFSIGTGIGFKIVDRVTVYGRYNFGLTDVTSYDPTIIHHSNVGQIGVAIRLKTL
jgi:outer membrane protein with beta-barrel domain